MDGQVGKLTFCVVQPPQFSFCKSFLWSFFFFFFPKEGASGFLRGNEWRETVLGQAVTRILSVFVQTGPSSWILCIPFSSLPKPVFLIVCFGPREVGVLWKVFESARPGSEN